MTGELRFHDPLPAEPRGRELNARNTAPIAPQGRSRLALAMGDFTLPQSEDCLTLDICAPDCAPGARKPVIAWIHGGAFTSGAGSLPWYGGSALARNGDVVTVGINYRLGALGFLYLPGLSAGNLGLKDQVLALQWIKQNIHHFGGDPENITVMGQSAGGASIAAMLTMPELDGLFRRAIMQSASMGRMFNAPDESERLGRAYLKLLDIQPDRAAELRKVPVDRLLQAQQALGAAERKLAQTKPPFWLVRDGAYIRSELLDTLGPQRKLGIDLLIGTTREEMAAFYRHDDAVRNAGADVVEQLFRVEFGDKAAIYMDAYKRRRALPNAAALLGDMNTDKVFRLGSLELAGLFGRKGLSAHVYQFDWQSPAGYESCHCLELPFVFGDLRPWAGAPMLEGMDTHEFEGLSGAMQQAWAAFAHGGDPGHAGIPRWKAYTDENRNVMHFGRVIEPRRAWIAPEPD
jgi:para-nitrobenzyl esterase